MHLSQFQMFKMRQAFSPRVRMRVWKKISVQTKCGIQLFESLSILYRQAVENKSCLADIYQIVLQNKSRGQNLGTAFSGFISTSEAMLISSGEMGGNLSEGLDLAESYLKNQENIRKSFISACAYPFFLFLSCVGMMLAIAFLVMPQLIQFSDPNKWEGFAYVLYVTSEFVSSYYGLASAVIVVSLIFVVFWSMPRWVGPSRMRVENIAPWSIYKIITGTTWLFGSSGFSVGSPCQELAG